MGEETEGESEREWGETGGKGRRKMKGTTALAGHACQLSGTASPRLGVLSADNDPDDDVGLAGTAGLRSCADAGSGIVTVGAVAGAGGLIACVEHTQCSAYTPSLFRTGGTGYWRQKRLMSRIRFSSAMHDEKG